jgi:hypothetical protein
VISFGPNANFAMSTVAADGAAASVGDIPKTAQKSSARAALPRTGWVVLRKEA